MIFKNKTLIYPYLYWCWNTRKVAR